MKVGGGDTAQDNSGGTGACLPPAKHTSTITTKKYLRKYLRKYSRNI